MDMARGTGFSDSIRQPEYTGENRCLPCTAVNAVIAVGVSAVIASAVVWAGVLFFALSVLVIYLRGYLVPGTPTLTRKYLPERVLGAFDSHPQPRKTTDTPEWDAIERHRQRKQRSVDPEQYLLDGGVLESAADGDSTHTAESEYELTDSFARRIREERETLAEEQLWWHNGDTGFDEETLSELLDVKPESIRLQNEEYPSFRVNARIRQWPSSSALRADVTTDRALSATLEDWKSVPLEQRLRILSVLRAFRTRCPCGGTLTETTDTIESCCRSGNVIALTCEHCGDSILERDPTATNWFSIGDV